MAPGVQDAVAQRVTPRGGGGYRRLAAETRPINWELVDSFRTKFLARLPLTLSVTLEGKRYFLVHGSPRDPLDEYLPDEADAWRARLEGIDADFICTGHTHVPMDLDVDGRRIINPGSVGQPRDGDPRASYAIIEDGIAQLRADVGQEALPDGSMTFIHVERDVGYGEIVARVEIVAGIVDVKVDHKGRAKAGQRLTIS